jgi:uncharacterized protein involved in exopolysaccharide biosynthesis
VLLEQALAKKNVLAAQLKEVQDSTSSDWGVSNISQEISAEEARIQSLKDKKTDLLLKYTDRHPQVIGIDKLIEDLQKQSDDNRKNNANIATEANGDVIGAEKLSNPYVQTLKMAFDSAEAEVAADQSLLDSLTERVAKLESGLKDKLSLQTEMKNLNRDYDTLSKQYSSLLDRREQAHITERVDDQTSRLKFRVADPPTKATKPSFPYRYVFYSMAFVVGIGLGFTAALGIYMIKPLYMSHRQVRVNTGLPSLGSISLTARGEESLVKHDYVFMLGVGLLLIGYAGVMIVELLK